MQEIRVRKSVKTNAVLNVIKQLFSVIFPMITFPYATRILGTANYGKYTFSLSIVNYIAYIAAAGILRYAVRECARVREDNDKLSNLVNEIFTINITTTIIAYVLLAGLLAFIPGLRPYGPLILIISISVLFTTLGTDWINSAYEDYFFITVRYIVSQAIAVCVLFILVRTSDDIARYAFVSISGGILANILNIIHIRRTLKITPRIVYSRDLVRHIRPILYLFVCTIATFIYINSDVTILGIFAGDVSVGYYGVSTQFYQMIKQMITAAFIVVIPRISNELARDVKAAYERYNKILEITILLIIPCTIGLYMIRTNLVLLFSGREYIQASSSLAILAIALIPAMLANFFINIVMIPLRQEREVMIATVASAAVNVALNFILIPHYAENAAAFTTLLAEITMTIIAIFYCHSIRFKGVLKPIIAGLAGGTLIFLICMLLNREVENCFINVVFCVICSIIAYGAVISIFYKEEAAAGFRKVFRKK